MDEIVRKLDPAPDSRAPATSAPGGLDRDIRFRVMASGHEHQRKSAEVWSEAGGQRVSSRWSIQCDEGARLGGSDAAPSPLAYFSAAVAF